MASPTAPTLNSISSEAVKKAGISNENSTQYVTLLLRCNSTLIEEVKYDIWATLKNIKCLQKTGVLITAAGQAQYSMPSDYSSLVSCELLDGSVTGTAQANTDVSKIILASSDTGASGSYVGSEVVITGGTGANQISRITSYDKTTKVATVSPSFTTAPTTGSTYLIVANYFDLNEAPLWDYASGNAVTGVSLPYCYFPYGSGADSSIILYPNPDKVYGVKVLYYADLLELDTSSTTMATFYKRFRNVLVQGLLAKLLQSLNDDRYAVEDKKYIGLIRTMMAREEYGMDLTNLRTTVGDY